MKRKQLVELEDLPWFPAVWRDAGTTYLEFVLRHSGHGKMLAPRLEQALKDTGATEVVDLCSGGGGPAGIVAEELAARGMPVKMSLSDRFPNVPALSRVEAASGGRVSVVREPVDATAVPPTLTGFRTIFNAFHHFPPDLARSILQDAVRARQPIAIFEVVSREPLMLLAMLTAPLGVMATMPLWRPFRWQWLLWTWILPIIPLFVLWDGIVSWLRIYDEDELRALVAGIDAPDWTWEIGKTKLGDAPAHAIWLVGRPVVS